MSRLYVDDVVARAGSVDVPLQLISYGDVQGTPLVEMTIDDLLRAPITGLHRNFLTARGGIWTAGVEETLASDKLAEVDPNAPDPQTVIDMISAWPRCGGPRGWPTSPRPRRSSPRTARPASPAR